MLKTRIITALVVLPFVLLALFTFPVWAWCLFTLGIVLVSLWEWSRFCGWHGAAAGAYLAFSAVVAAAFAIVAVQFPDTYRVLLKLVLLIALLFWVVAAPFWLLRQWRPAAPILLGITGWLVLFPFGMALIALREIGALVLLAFAAIVWVADIAAYFVGKAFGKHKLAPAVSPGKTWEGVAGGLAGVAVLWSLLFWGVSKHHQWPLAIDMSNAFIPGLAIYLALCAVSVVGDLFESWMKRGAGLKDSSNLLPGHGGFLDRIDALTPTLPIACALMLMIR